MTNHQAKNTVREALIIGVPSSPTTKTNLILAALEKEGFRILGPGELDPKTIEACIDVAESKFTKDSVLKNTKGEPYLSGKVAIYTSQRIASALQCLYVNAINKSQDDSEQTEHGRERPNSKSEEQQPL